MDDDGLRPAARDLFCVSPSKALWHFPAKAD